MYPLRKRRFTMGTNKSFSLYRRLFPEIVVEMRTRMIGGVLFFCLLAPAFWRGLRRKSPVVILLFWLFKFWELVR